MSATVFLVIFLGAWALVGITVGVVMTRKGHSAFVWALIGIVFGPISVPLARAAHGHARLELAGDATVVTPGSPGAGPIDLLCGVDGSPESVRAVNHAVALFGPRVGRLTLATVIDYDLAGAAVPQDREEVIAALDACAQEIVGPRPDTVLLAGDPAHALSEHAEREGYDVVVAAARGRGLSRMLGSVASALARGLERPALIVGHVPAEPAAPHPPATPGSETARLPSRHLVD